MSTQRNRFAGHPAAIIYEAPDLKKPPKQLLWGDYIRLTGPKKGSVYPVYSRGVKGWIPLSAYHAGNILEFPSVP